MEKKMKLIAKAQTYGHPNDSTAFLVLPDLCCATGQEELDGVWEIWDAPLLLVFIPRFSSFVWRSRKGDKALHFKSNKSPRPRNSNTRFCWKTNRFTQCPASRFFMQSIGWCEVGLSPTLSHRHFITNFFWGGQGRLRCDPAFSVVHNHFVSFPLHFLFIQLLSYIIPTNQGLSIKPNDIAMLIANQVWLCNLVFEDQAKQFGIHSRLVQGERFFRLSPPPPPHVFLCYEDSLLTDCLSDTGRWRA